MKRILVCGGRDYRNNASVDKVLQQFKSPTVVVIQGGARGADALAAHWCRSNGVHCAEVNARWDAYGRTAGRLRNAAMLALQPDLCVAFPGGAGTRNMVQQCKDAGVPVVEVPQ